MSRDRHDETAARIVRDVTHAIHPNLARELEGFIAAALLAAEERAIERAAVRVEAVRIDAFLDTACPVDVRETCAAAVRGGYRVVKEYAWCVRHPAHEGLCWWRATKWWSTTKSDRTVYPTRAAAEAARPSADAVLVPIRRRVSP